MKTLLFIHANNCDVQIVEIICNTVVTMTITIAVCYLAIQVAKFIFDWMKSQEFGKQKEKQNQVEKKDTKEEERKYELQKQDRAKALVKDFFEATKDKDQQKDLQTAQNLLEMYEKVLSGNLKKTNNV